MENTPQQQEEGKEIIRVLACVMNKLIEANQNTPNIVSRDITKFHALEPPNISIYDYLERIHKYACCSNECFILSLIYVDRLIQMNNFALTALNVHRVIITSVMLAAKFFDDQYFNNAYYAKVGGVPVNEMNSLEVELLFRLNFSLHVTSDAFKKYKMELSHHASINFCKCAKGLQHSIDQASLNRSSQPAFQHYTADYEERPQQIKAGQVGTEVGIQNSTEPSNVGSNNRNFSAAVQLNPQVVNYPVAQVNPQGISSFGYLQSTFTPQQVVYQQHMVHPQLEPQEKLSQFPGKSFQHSSWNNVHTKHHMAYFQDGGSHPLFDEAVR